MSVILILSVFITIICVGVVLKQASSETDYAVALIKSQKTEAALRAELQKYKLHEFEPGSESVEAIMAQELAKVKRRNGKHLQRQPGHRKMVRQWAKK